MDRDNIFSSEANDLSLAGTRSAKNKPDILIEKIMMECPICGKAHFVEKRQREGQAYIKGQLIFFNEVYCLCNEQEQAYEFITGEMMDANLLEARNAYCLEKRVSTSQEPASSPQK